MPVARYTRIGYSGNGVHYCTSTCATIRNPDTRIVDGMATWVDRNGAPMVGLWTDHPVRQLNYYSVPLRMDSIPPNGEYVDHDEYCEWTCDRCAASLCQECRQCDHCNQLFAIDDLTALGDGDYACQNCREQYYTQCSACSDWVIDSGIYYDSETDDPYCDDCYHNTHTDCRECGEWRVTDQMIEMRDRRLYCQSCADVLDESDDESDGGDTCDCEECIGDIAPVSPICYTYRNRRS